MTMPRASAVALNLEASKAAVEKGVGATNPAFQAMLGGVDPRHYLSSGAAAMPVDANGVRLAARADGRRHDRQAQGTHQQRLSEGNHETLTLRRFGTSPPGIRSRRLWRRHALRSGLHRTRCSQRSPTRRCTATGWSAQTSSGTLTRLAGRSDRGFITGSVWACSRSTTTPRCSRCEPPHRLVLHARARPIGHREGQPDARGPATVGRR